MAVEPVPPLAVVRPDYQSVEGYRRDVWRGRAAVLVPIAAFAVIVAAAFAVRAGFERWAQARARAYDAFIEHKHLLASEAQCMNYDAPPTQAVYSEVPEEAEAMLGQDGCFELQPLAVGFQCGMSPWLQGPPARVDPPPKVIRSGVARYPVAVCRYFDVRPASPPAAFVGRLRSRGGAVRLVIVSVTPSDVPALAEPRSLNFKAVPYRPAGPKPTQPPDAGPASYLKVPVSPWAAVRVLAGQHGASDPARFTIGYELDGSRGQVAGHLDDDGTVVLETAQ